MTAWRCGCSARTPTPITTEEAEGTSGGWGTGEPSCARAASRKAEDADRTPLDDALSIPAEVQRRQERQAQLAQARAEIEARAALNGESAR